MLSARVLLQSGREHEETMAIMSAFQEDHLKMHKEMCDMHREKVGTQEERWRVKAEETRMFQPSMDRSVDIMV